MGPAEDALSTVLRVARPLPAERIATAVADGRVLAEDLHSPENVPPFRASTVDGFAVIAADEAPERVVIEHITAGVVGTPRIVPGTAARIMTGAPLPEGADAVVMIEDTHQSDGRVEIARPARPGDNIRPIGVDVAQGDLLLSTGAVLGAAEIGLLMTLGFTEISCYRRPTVAVLSTG